MGELGFIHRYLPPQEGSTRVLLLLHGTGGNEDDLLSLGRALDPNAAMLSPRGKVLENGAPRFFRRLAEGVFDEEDVVRRANELANFIAAAAEHYKFEPQNSVVIGYSNGANIASATMLLRPESIHSAVLFRAMEVLSDPPAPDLSGRRALICAGVDDPIIPLENARRLAVLLRGCGVAVDFREQQASHGLVPEDIVTARGWLAA